MYTEEELIRELTTFKIDTLQRVLKLELRVEALDEDNDDILKDIQLLKDLIVKDVEVLNQKIDLVQSDTPSIRSVQVMVSITAVVVAMFAAFMTMMK